MSLQTYFKKEREKMFPHIDDWTDPQDSYKVLDVNLLSHKEWLWFHPSAFNLIRIGSNVIGMVIFSILSLVFAVREFFVGMGFSIVIVAILGYALRNMLKTYDQYKNTTLYDVFMRDYK